jgi:hypothetical protein
MNILEQSMNYSNILSIIDIFEGFSNINKNETMVNFTEDMIDILKDKDSLNKIVDILKYNSSKEAKLLSEIINEEIKKEENK